MTKEEEKRAKAKEMRYKKPILSGLSLETIECDTMDIMDAVYDVQWMQQLELIDELLEEDEAAEFKMLFSALEHDLERFKEDLECCWVPDCYEDLMVSIAGSSGTEILGFDSYEEDYFGIEPGYQTQLAMKEAEKRLMRLTKQQMIEAAQQCFLVAFNYIAIRNRFNELKCSIDVLRGGTNGLLKQIERINEAHEKAYGEKPYREYLKWGGGRPTKDMTEYDRLLDQFDPYDRIWVE